MLPVMIVKVLVPQPGAVKRILYSRWCLPAGSPTVEILGVRLELSWVILAKIVHPSTRRYAQRNSFFQH